MLRRKVGHDENLSGFGGRVVRFLTVVTLVLVACAGCGPSEPAKMLAQERWQKASARIKLSLAQQQYDEGRYEQATTTVRQCVQADQQFPLAHLLLGKLLLVQGDVDGATTELKLVLELDAELDEAWYWLGVSAQHQQDNEKAYEFYQKAITLKPTDVDYVLAVAEVMVARGDRAEAAAFLEQRILVLPNEISLHAATADLMCRLENHERAVQLYRKAMLMTEDNGDIAESLGYCYMFTGRWALASEVFGELVQSCSDEQKKSTYLEAEALCSMNCGRYDRAMACYRKLGRQDGDNAQIWVKMGQAALGAGISHRALRCGREALALRPDYPEAVALLGSALYATGEFEAAVETFEKLTVDSTNGGFPWLMKARCYEKLGRQDEAQQAYEKAQEVDPGNRLGNLLAGTGGRKS
jgi:tetratricopeptide (TPR) repeat protein